MGQLLNDQGEACTEPFATKLLVADSSGQATTYSISGPNAGLVESIRTSSGKIVTMADYAASVTQGLDSSGNLSSISTATSGQYYGNLAKLVLKGTLQNSF